MGSYFRPSSLQDALAALTARRVLTLAGGTDYFPARVGHGSHDDILDIIALPALSRIEACDEHWSIPCLATWADIVATPLPRMFDGLKQAARQVGGAQIQNVGTLVGNLCNASPAADGVPCLLALDASVELASTSGSRVIRVEDFVLGPRATALRPDEIVLRVRVPRMREDARSVFLKLGGRRYLVISIAMVAAVISRDADGRIEQARIAVGSCAGTARRLPALEAALVGSSGETLVIQDEHLRPLSPIDDMRGSAAYRLDAVGTLLRRAVAP